MPGLYRKRTSNSKVAYIVKWVTRNRTHLSAPYTIHGNVRGYEVWINAKGKFGCLGRELPTLDKAKAFCEQHKAKQVANA